MNAASGAASGECAAGTGDDTITFSVTGTVNLTGALPDLSTNVTIGGPGAKLLTLRRNTGGDYRIFTVASGAAVNISGLTVTNGRTPDGHGAFTDAGNGGGIFTAGTLKLTAMSVSDNLTGNGVFTDSNTANWRGGDGGGIYNKGTLDLVGVTVSGNRTGTSDQFSLGGTNPTGGAGGGIFNSGTASVTNSTISGNQTAIGGGQGSNTGNAGPGGGVANVGSMTFTHSTVYSNVSGGVGGIDSKPSFSFTAGSATIRNSIVAGNNVDVFGPVTLQGNNIIGRNDNEDPMTTPPGPDPKLGPLQDNGGPTLTHAPLPGSVAINGADNSFAKDQNNVPLTTDQRGFPRAADASNIADIGAVEVNYQIAATGGTPQSAPINTDFATPLQATLNESGRPIQGVTVTFTAPAGGASGTFPGGNTAVTNAGGQAAVTFRASATAGGYNVTANITPALAAPAVFSLTNGKTQPSTSLVSSANPAASGQTVTFTATVTSPVGTPTGTVQFKVDGANLGTPVALNASGAASASTSTLALGAHTVTAVYGGDTNFNTSTGTLAGGQSVLPTVSITDTFKPEGDESNETSFGVQLSAAVNFPVTVKYATADGTAMSPSDYQAATGTVIFQPGESFKLFSVTVNGDTTYEDTETFFVDLSMPTNAIIDRGRGTELIINDDPTGGVIEFDKSSYTVAEGGSITVTVNRTLYTNLAVDVDYATDDGSTSSVVVPCSSVTGIALDRCDYTKALGTLHFAPGEAEKTFEVLVGDDSYAEGPETAHLRLSNPRGNAALGPKSAATFTITDDSPERSGNPIDDTDAFVRQNYLDFLNREPDSSGFQFWRNNIESCGSNAPCREAKRVDTSAAFFLSIEFQETGYLVYRAYKSAYGDATSPNVSGTVPVVRLEEFLPDTQRIGQGVVVGQGAWQQQLETNKQDYFAAFVARTRFAAANPRTLSPTQFADALFANAGVTPTAAQRQAVIDEFVGASGTSNLAARARALRRVAENSTLAQAEFNRAFVLMEYYGYLRRNPNDAPEPTLNFAGWKFWLDKLNQFGGNYVAAEMVRAFISSDEYRHRFGQ
jgi:hypothetical protein